MTLNKEVFGYFEGTNDEPAHDPGIDTYCLFCTKKLSKPIKCISLMIPWDTKSYFYRCHKSCYEVAQLDWSIKDYESGLIDMNNDPDLISDHT